MPVPDTLPIDSQITVPEKDDEDATQEPPPKEEANLPPVKEDPSLENSMVDPIGNNKNAIIFLRREKHKKRQIASPCR